MQTSMGMTTNHDNAADFTELRALLASAVLNDASDEQLDRLNEVLKAGVELRRYASQFLAEESMLRREFEMLSRVVDFHQPPIESNGCDRIGHASAVPVAGLTTTSAAAISKWPTVVRMSAFLAATVLIAVGFGALWNRERVRNAEVAQNSGPILPQEVGLLVRTPVVNWRCKTDFAAAQPFRIGDVISTDGGVTNLRFNCGAEVLLKGPAELEVISPMRASLRRGTLTARVHESAHGFRIDTPNSKVIDLGTEFGLTVDGTGSTDTVVFSGKVALQYPEFRPAESDPANATSKLKVARRLSEGRLLTEGEAMRVLQSGEVQRLVAVKSSDYPMPRETASPAQSNWAPIIVSVADNLRDGDTAMCYRIVHQGFGEDARAYVDRPYQWNGLNAEYGLPTFLRGADYVMPFCDDKLSSHLEVRIGISRPARLYVLVDDRVPSPQWLVDDFHDTGYDLGVDESARAASWQSLSTGPGVSVDKCFSVWYRDVVKASTVVLGSMKSPTNISLMYGIAAIPLETALAIPAEPVRNHQPRIGSGLARPDVLPKPAAEVLTERAGSFADLKVARSSAEDAASLSRGVVFHIESNGGNFLPHKQVRVDKETLPTLNDGEVSRNEDDLSRNVWYDGQGRFSVDLLKPLQISQINTFSWHRFERAPQYFTVWGSNQPKLPATDFDVAEEASGWEYVGIVNSHQLGHGGVHASSLRRVGGGNLGPYRYLLWIAENNVRGTFFTEIDVHAVAE